MPPKKKCAMRKTKAMPNVYLRKELEVLARQQGILRKDIRGMTKKQLCYALNIKWNKSKSKVKSKKKSVEIIFLDKKPCNVRRSKSRPDVLTKPELVELAMKHLKYKKSEAMRKTKAILCVELESAGVKVKRPGVDNPRKPSHPKITGDCIKKSKLPLRPHQKVVVEYLMNHRGVIAAHGVGSGKTLTAVTASQCILQKHPDWKVVVVTPTSLQENFKKEIRAYGADPKDKRYIFKTMQGFANAYNKGDLVCSSKTFLIIDEAHNLRTDLVPARRAAKRRGGNPPQAATALNCSKRAGKVLLLTATPTYNNPRDVANLVAMIKGEEPLTKNEFKGLMNSPMRFKRYFECLFSYYSVPKTKDYPDVKEHSIKIIMDDKYWKKYRTVEAKNSHLFEDPWRFLGGLRQATNALEPCQKCIWAVNKIKEKQKTVLYSAFRTHGIEKIQDMLQGSRIKFVEVTGSMSMKNRANAVKEFNSAEGANVLFITKAGGEGLDLKGVRNVIILEAGWNRAGEEQVIGRAVRYRSHAHLPKKDRNVKVYHLMVIKSRKAYVGIKKKDRRGSADEMLKEMIEKKIKENSDFEEQLRELSIEQLEGCR